MRKKHLIRNFAFAVLLAGFVQNAAGQTRLPDTETVSFAGYSAWLTDPTDRYRHAVLGDAIEAGGFAIRAPDGRTLMFRLEADAVFEDRRVRLHDLDGDGTPEAIIIKSTQSGGAGIAIYRLGSLSISLLLELPRIGTANRWLNIVGIADFNGDGRLDVAYVQTPHLTGLLRVFSIEGSRYREIGQLPGYTNHIIGSRDLDLAAAGSFTGSGRREIVIPSLDRRFLALLGFRDGKLQELSRKRLPARASGNLHIQDTINGVLSVVQGAGVLGASMGLGRPAAGVALGAFLAQQGVGLYLKKKQISGGEEEKSVVTHAVDNVKAMFSKPAQV